MSAESLGKLTQISSITPAQLIAGTNDTQSP